MAWALRANIKLMLGACHKFNDSLRLFIYFIYCCCTALEAFFCLRFPMTLKQRLYLEGVKCKYSHERGVDSFAMAQ
jgi:hypothetical protein